MTPETALNRLHALVGPEGWLDPDREPDLLAERRGRFHAAAAALVAPADTAEVAAVVALCAAAGLAVVPQGGNTGLCAGACPQDAGRQVLLSLRRLDRIRELDAADFTLTAEAGCRLADVQAAAAGANRLFPLSYAAEGECRIGGNLATNAGGMNVLRYGNARDLALGLEVVTADGRIWNGLRRLRKDNSGLDLKDLFIGAEGSLGIITAAVLKLFPRPRRRATALAALPDVCSAVTLLGRLRQASGDALVACELMGRTPVQFALDHAPDCAEPFAAAHPWYLLLDAADAAADAGLDRTLAAALDSARAEGLVADARATADAAEAAALWALRRGIPTAQKAEGGSIKHDVSVPVSRIPEFLERAGAAVATRLPGVRVCAFGHLGDGNIHYNLSQPRDMDSAAFLALWEEMNALVHAVVVELDGSIAAEHGVGRLKTHLLPRYKSDVEIDLMRRVKTALDPRGIMNPGVLMPEKRED